MTSSQMDSTIIVDDDQPIAVRRKRRSSTGPNALSRSNSQTSISQPHGIATPPSTPKRSKKRVRFSDPGLEIQAEPSSTGLTPFIRRTSLLSTPPSKRRHSTPAPLWNLADYDAPLSGTVQFAPLRQVLDGRVKRRLRRNRLSEEVNAIDLDKRHEAKSQRAEVQKLKAELAAKDLEVQSMRDEQEIASQIGAESGTSIATDTTLSTKVQELEHQILDLQAQLRLQEIDAMEDPNWTMAAKDPFELDEDDNMMTNYDEDFRESMMNDELLTTPTRLNTSFPSPPSTIPNTPCKSTTSVSAGTQATLPIPDPEKELLQTQLEALQCEVSKLTAAVAFKEDNHSRLTEKLSEFLPNDESCDHTSLDSALDAVLTQLALSQSQVVDSSNAFSALSTEVTSLGFSSCPGPEEVLATIASQFRQARLDLEYLTPGEVVEGFENEKLLDMLLSRIRVLVQQVKEHDDSIDQYHEQEISLRQQLNTRVDAMREVQSKLMLTNTVVRDLRDELHDKESSNSKLQQALEDYRAEVTGLEKLIERMDQDNREHVSQLKDEIREVEERLQDEILKHDSARADAEGKDLTITELERRLNLALQAAAVVQTELAALSSTHDAQVSQKDATIRTLQTSISEREKTHGDALALRDARVSELRREVERVNEVLKSAHTVILGLRRENQSLKAQVEGEKVRGRVVVDAMREQLARVLETGKGYVEGAVTVRGPESARGSSEGGGLEEGNAVTRGGFLDGNLARKSGKKRRRYDSGLGFLEEADDELTARVEAEADSL